MEFHTSAVMERNLCRNCDFHVCKRNTTPVFALIPAAIMEIQSQLNGVDEFIS